MKKLFILILFATLSTGTKAQTFAEWFRQRATQKKYLLQQIAALQVYIGYVQKGYSIAKQGLNTISDIKNGEFNLHKDYFNSLKTVNPKIKNYSKVADIIVLQVNIIKVYKEAAKQVKQSGSFNAGEISYINGVFERLLDDCTKTIDALITVTTNGELEMKDDERLKRIDALYTDMQDKYTFVQGFSNEAKLLATSRIREQNDIQTIRAINSIKN
jgi:hypothetical protein